MTHDSSGSNEASFSQAKIANEVIKVEKSKHQLQQLKDTVIHRQQAINRTTELMISAREHWTAWPEKHLAKIAKRLGVPKNSLEALLQPSIDHHLQELGDICIRLD